MNTLLTLAFNGAAYHGFQVQQNALGVCTVLQNAMQDVLGARPDVKGSSRTDAGVHARCFCVNFKHALALPLAKLPLALNSRLPADVRVTGAYAVPEGFHARYDAVGKEYEYVILNNAVDDPFQPGLYYRVPYPLDAKAMQSAAAHLVGRHDFASFMSAGSTVQSTVRRVAWLDVTRTDTWVRIRIAADGFLYNMVRIVAGTLLAAGLGKMPPQEAGRILGAGNRAAAGDTLPAKGLFLNRVFYPGLGGVFEPPPRFAAL